MRPERQFPTVSVVVVNYRLPADTITCLRAVRDGVDYPSGRLQLVVVDNGSGDGSAERIRAEVPQALLVQAPSNLGFAAGCNLGAAHATGEILALLNSDARPHPRWVRAAVDVLGGEPDVGAVASKVLDWEGRLVDYAGGGLSWFGMGYSPRHGRPDDARYDQPADVLFATGAAMFVRAQLFEQVGGFDQRYFMFYEDVDLGWRLNLRGHRVRYEPRSIVYHRGHASMAGAGRFRELCLLERNALISLYKNLEDASLAKVLPAALALTVRRGTARGGLDRDLFDLRNRGNGEDDQTMAVPKATMASVLAVDQFVELLPSLAPSRAVEQRARVRSDAQLLPLFGNAFEPLAGMPDYLRAHQVVRAAFGLDTMFDHGNGALGRATGRLRRLLEGRRRRPPAAVNAQDERRASG